MTDKTVEVVLIKDGRLTPDEIIRETNNIIKENPDLDKINMLILEKEVIPVTGTVPEDK